MADDPEALSCSDGTHLPDPGSEPPFQSDPDIVDLLDSMSVPAVDDERLRYVEVQIDRDVWLRLVARGLVPR